MYLMVRRSVEDAGMVVVDGKVNVTVVAFLFSQICSASTAAVPAVEFLTE